MSEKFRMMMERYTGYVTMHGRDMHKDPDAWGEPIREQHKAIVRYVEDMEAALGRDRRTPRSDPEIEIVRRWLMGGPSGYDTERASKNVSSNNSMLGGTPLPDAKSTGHNTSRPELATGGGDGSAEIAAHAHGMGQECAVNDCIRILETNNCTSDRAAAATLREHFSFLKLAPPKEEA